MIKNVITAMVTILTVIFLGGLGQEAQAVEAVTQTSTTVNYHKVENLVRIADNVIILFDSSETMGKPFDSSGMTKLQAAKKIITQRTALLPDAIPGLNMGVYTYSYVPPTANTISNLENSTYYKMQPFNKAKFQKALEQLPSKASGPTLMVNGIRRLGRLLEDLSGRTVPWFLCLPMAPMVIKALAKARLN